MDIQPKKTNNSGVQLSQVAFSWSHQDYIKYQKDRKWYLISALLLVLAVAWSIWDKNYFFAVFLVLFYLVTMMYEKRLPKDVDFYITAEGVKSGDNFYFYREIDHFYIIYRANGLKNLYIEFKNPFSGRLVIPLEGQNAVAIRDYLLQFIKEDLEREAEPLSEQLRKFLKL